MDGSDFRSSTPATSDFGGDFGVRLPNRETTRKKPGHKCPPEQTVDSVCVGAFKARMEIPELVQWDIKFDRRALNLNFRQGERN